MSLQSIFDAVVLGVIEGITEFIPVLVHRYAREELLLIRDDELRSAA